MFAGGSGRSNFGHLNIISTNLARFKHRANVVPPRVSTLVRGIETSGRRHQSAIHLSSSKLGEKTSLVCSVSSSRSSEFLIECSKHFLNKSIIITVLIIIIRRFRVVRITRAGFPRNEGISLHPDSGRGTLWVSICRGNCSNFW